MKTDEFIDEFSQLPSKTGKDVIDLEEYAKLPRTKTYDAVKSFLEAARKSNEVKALFIVAEWGEGKTSIYEGLLQKPEVIKSDLVIPISTKRLITFIKERSGQFNDTGSPGIRFFACLLYSIKDVIDNDLVQIPPFDKIKILPKSENQPTMLFILNGLKSILNIVNQEARIFVFLDEFEDIVDESADIQSFIRAGLVDLINGHPKCLCQDPYAGRFHLLIAATPPAFERIRAGIYTDAQRLFGQRILDVELEKLDRKSACDYVLGILKYCWKGKLPRIPFCKPGMLNAIYLATWGNPRAIVNLIELLLAHAKLYVPKGKIRLVNPEQFVSILSGQKIQVYGGEVNILDRESLSMLYSKIEHKCEKSGLDKEKCINFVWLLLSNPVPTSEELIKQELNLGKLFPEYLAIIGTSFNELWGIEPFIYFKKVIEGQDEVYSRIKSPKVPKFLSSIVKALEFYEYGPDNLSLVKTLFVPFRELSKLSFENKPMFQNFIDFFTGISQELRSEDEIRTLVDREIFDKVKRSEENYLMLSPSALNVFYSPPSIFFLDFIEDLDKRFEIGMELTRNLTSFEKQFYSGIFKLLEDGCRNIKVDRRFEPCGFKDVELIDLSYVEIDQRYKLRARVVSFLKMIETQFQDEIKKVIDELKTAHIPLLLIFSYNPLSTEVKGMLETFFKSDKGFERIYHYIDFPFNIFHCQQIVGYTIAHERNYNIKEERWKARASRILDELKFEEELKKFIEAGMREGYTIKPLRLEELKLSEIPGVLRTLLVTEGSVKDRYKQICDLEEKFRIYGKDFPVCPKDVESETALERFVDDLSRNGITKRGEEGLETELVSIERRILSILRDYKRPLQKDEIDKLFINTTSGGSTFKTDIYLSLLLERQLIKFDKKENSYSLQGIEHLDAEFKTLKKELSSFKNVFEASPFGYFVSIKQYDVNAIIIKNCVAELEKLAETLEKTQYHPDYQERRVRKFILFKLLMEQLKSMYELHEEFTKILDYNYRKGETITVKRSLDNLEERLNNLLSTEKRIKIKEKYQLEEKEKSIKELENKNYSDEEIKEVGLKLKEKIGQFSGLYKEFRSCPVFDVKIVELAEAFKDLQDFVENCEGKLKVIENRETELRDLKESIDGHKLFELKYSEEEAPISTVLLNWILQNYGRKKEES